MSPKISINPKTPAYAVKINIVKHGSLTRKSQEALITKKLKIGHYNSSIIETPFKPTDTTPDDIVKYSYNSNYHHKLAKEDFIDGLDYPRLLHHIGVRCKGLNKPEILQNIVGLPNKQTENAINSVQQHIGPTVEQQEEKGIPVKKALTEKDFICSPILKDKHWTVAIISKNEVNIFDPTLQTRVSGTDLCKLKIGDMKEERTFNCLNKDYQIQKYPAESTICALCSAEFIIWASQCESLEHLRNNMDRICNNIAVNVVKVIGPENAKEQLTEDFQNRAHTPEYEIGQNNPFPGLELTSNLQNETETSIQHQSPGNNIPYKSQLDLSKTQSFSSI